MEEGQMMECLKKLHYHIIRTEGRMQNWKTQQDKFAANCDHVRSHLVCCACEQRNLQLCAFVVSKNGIESYFAISIVDPGETKQKSDYHLLNVKPKNSKSLFFSYALPLIVPAEKKSNEPTAPHKSFL
jgi:hypothetical protein